MKHFVPVWVTTPMVKKVQIAGIIATCLLVVISLLTFDPQDASLWHHVSHVKPYSNWLGIFGANFASLCFYFFGKAAYLFIFLSMYVIFFAWNRFAWKKESDRIFGWLLGMLTSSVWCAVYDVDTFYLARPGGRLGSFLHAMMRLEFSLLAQKIIIFLLLWASLLLITRMQLIFLARAVIRFVHYLARQDTVLRKILLYCARMVYAVISVLLYYIVGMYKNLTGKMLGSASVIEFEHGQSVDDILHEVLTPQQKKEYAAAMQDEQEIALHTEVVLQTQESVHSPHAVQDVQYAVPDVQGMFSKRVHAHKHDQNALDEQALILERKLEQFGVQGKVVAMHPGPVVTMFEYAPESHIKLSKIVALEDDLAMALQAVSIRIIAPIPGTPVVGFEVANKARHAVPFVDILQSKDFTNAKAKLPLILGKDPLGNHVIVDLASMPHMLIAGSTGSGKSVALNAMLVSLLCKYSPDDLKLIIIDPKRLEFAAYHDIAHLLFPVVTDPRRALPVLKWVVSTMEERYETMAMFGVRNIGDYHALSKPVDAPVMPLIVVIIDELADLMMTTGKDVEDVIARIAQMARAAGIHMIVATQRPSVDVITGLIKVNFTARVSFKVTSKIDSRTILDEAGAEKLLGRGDMLFMHSSDPYIRRVHGAYITDEEIEFVVQEIKKQRVVQYLDIQELLQHDQQKDDILFDGDDGLYQDILSFVQGCDEISISLLQRHFRIGYNRSARIMTKLESDGIILPSDGGKMRRVVK
jgi:DNA segregation ATPase FtsK/SpoIIIE-like protein